jgi:hypothetical protein
VGATKKRDSAGSNAHSDRSLLESARLSAPHKAAIAGHLQGRVVTASSAPEIPLAGDTQRKAGSHLAEYPLTGLRAWRFYGKAINR